MYTNNNLNIDLCKGEVICLKLSGDYFFGDSQRRLSDNWKIYITDDKIILEDDIEIIISSEELCLLPVKAEENCFAVCLDGEDISLNNFYRGDITLKNKEGNILVCNEVDIESFVVSVMCNSFSENSQLEYLKAIAIIVRNATILLAKENYTSIELLEDSFKGSGYNTFLNFHPENLKEKYLGVPESCNHIVHQAVKVTEGLALVFQDNICQIPQSICCGGMTEMLSDAFVRVCDSEQFNNIDLRQNENSEQWIFNGSDSYCNVQDLGSVKELLSGSGVRANQMYRWTKEIEIIHLNSLLRNKFNINVGKIVDIEALSRGTSGAIRQISIVGDVSKVTLEEELDKLFGLLELPSACFVVEKQLGENQGKLELLGSGTGSATGICHVGAWNMSQQGKNMKEILDHYLPQFIIEKQY